MGGILDLGIEIILFLQGLGLWLRGPMLFLSYLGTEPFFLLIAPVFLWCVDAGWGIRAGLTLALGNSLNTIFKIVISGPRPYWIDDRVMPLSSEFSFGAPSGHAVNAVSMWGVLAAWANRRWTWMVALLLMFLIGLSRMYLGMHFPHDVLLGWLIGATLLAAIFGGERMLKPWLERSRTETIILAAFAFSMGLILLTAGVRWGAQDWTMPEAWAFLSARQPSGDPIDPLALDGSVATAAIFFGVASGAALLKRRGWFDAGGPLEKRALRYILGLLGMLALYIGLDMVFPEGTTLAAFIFRYIRYMLVGLWAAFLAPELFIRLKLAERGDHPSEDSTHSRKSAETPGVF